MMGLNMFLERHATIYFIVFLMFAVNSKQDLQIFTCWDVGNKEKQIKCVLCLYLTAVVGMMVTSSVIL